MNSLPPRSQLPTDCDINAAAVQPCLKCLVKILLSSVV